MSERGHMSDLSAQEATPEAVTRERDADVRLDPLALRRYERDPLADPATLFHEIRLVTGADSGFGSDVGGGAVSGEERARRAEIERIRADMGRRLRAPSDDEALKENQL